MSARSTPATLAAQRLGVAFRLHEYEHDPASGTAYATEAVEQLGIDARRVHKTLVVDVDGRPHVAVVPADASCDLKAVAAAFGGKRAAMADPGAVERGTGYVLGGVSPLGQKRRLPTVLDADAMTWPTILVSAGRRGLDLELAPADLVAALAAQVAAIARR